VKVFYQRHVNREVNDICDYYDEKSPGLGDRFLHEVLACVEGIKAHPLHWPPLADSPDKRKAQFKTFPYVLVYRVVDETSIRVLIVKYSSRDPRLGMKRK